jgi:hypothetical protein
MRRWIAPETDDDDATRRRARDARGAEKRDGEQKKRAKLCARV